MKEPTALAELALVADELPVAIWMGRVPDGEVVYTNRAFREVLGIEPPEGAARGAFVDPYGVHTRSGETYPESAMPFERVLSARAPVVVDDLVIHRRDGRKVFLRVFAKPVFDDAGTLTHVLEAFIDISREVESEHARAEGERRLARSQRLEAVGQLVAGIAHDFNNLLTVTKLAVSWLRGEERDTERLDALEQISSVTDSAVELIKNLLRFARRDRQINALFWIDETMRPIVEMARRTFDRAIELEVDLDASTAAVMGDSSQVEHLIMNLVLNARDAIVGKGRVVVRTRLESIAAGVERGGPPAGTYVVIEVADDGSGIDPAIRERIFEPYFTTKTQGAVKGTGLGLSIVHRIVESHRGFIDLLDNAPKGTVVRILLPTAAAPERTAADEAAARAPHRRVPSELPARGDSQLVLVVDDEPLVRASTAASLRALGFRVCEAADGVSAIALFRERHAEITAVVLDMAMPGLRGGDVYVVLREVRPDVRVLLVTGYALDEEVQAVLDLGVGGWLAKPYDDRQLVDALQRIGALSAA